jgi:act minimal PKS chain-length factor (CLF/KS beta)
MTAVITGIGVTAPTGLGTESYWDATVAGRSGITPIDRFDASGYPAQLAGQVPGFTASEHLPSRLVPQTDRMTQLALTAGAWALEDAGYDNETAADTFGEYGVSVVTAASGGGVEFAHRELENLWRKGKKFVSAYQSFAWFYAVNTGQLSIRHGGRGPCGTLVTEQAGGLDAVGHARRHVRRGVPLVITGGVDGALSPWGWVAQLSTGMVSGTAYRPFGTEADGYVPGEGGAILVLEDASSAAERGIPAYGEIAGYAATLDPRPGLDAPPGLRRAAELALADAGVTPAEVDAVFADAAGVPELDRIEAGVLCGLFGPNSVPVTAPKSATGRLFGGGAALDLAAALLSLRDGVLPPTPGVEHTEHPIDLVTGAARELRLRTLLVLARGYGGFNAAVVVRAHHGNGENPWRS